MRKLWSTLLVHNLTKLYKIYISNVKTDFLNTLYDNTCRYGELPVCLSPLCMEMYFYPNLTGHGDMHQYLPQQQKPSYIYTLYSYKYHHPTHPLSLFLCLNMKHFRPYNIFSLVHLSHYLSHICLKLYVFREYRQKVKFCLTLFKLFTLLSQIPYPYPVQLK